jgi:diaminohydroxyphosphoribosylaminopyrimidine deaminase/5-amino-6-(5-phosphoribosylamino)uracil reductase
MPGPDHEWLRAAVALSRRCRPSRTAFSVGAIVVAADGVEVAWGFSREQGEHDHAEEVALRKADRAGIPVLGATVYSSLEPCGARRSAPVPCAQLIVRHGIGRVVFALVEPDVFVSPFGGAALRSSGVTVVVLAAFAAEVREINAHLLGGTGP